MLTSLASSKMYTYKCLFMRSRNYAHWTAQQYRPTNLSTQFRKDYYDFYPRLIDKTIENAKYLDHPTVKDFLKRVANHYVRSPMEGEVMVYAYELLEKPENINDETLHQAYSIACVTEMTQDYFYMQDDVFDKSLSRAGKKCWHLLKDSNPMVMSDCNILRSLGNEILKQNVNKAIYAQIMDVNEDCYLLTESGQIFDFMLPNTQGYDHYTMDNYRKMCFYKASFFSAIYPTYMALILTNKAYEKTFQLVTDMFKNFGIMFQIHNDFTEYVDYDESISKKSNNDIQNRRCSWNAVTALQHFNKEDRKIFEECYGSRDPEKIKEVMKLYKKIDLLKLYRLVESSSYKEFLRKVKELPSDSTPSSKFFIEIMNFFQSYLSNVNRYYFR